jgi:signal peptidase I
MKIDVYVSGRKEKAPLPFMTRMIMFAASVFVAFVLVKVFFFVQFVKDDSMAPRIGKGALVVAGKMEKPKRDDIVIVCVPGKSGSAVISRVAAVAGDRVEIRDKKILLNGSEISRFTRSTDPRIFQPVFTERDNAAEITVPSGSYYLIGDNFDRAYDSRYFGVVKKKDIAGVVLKSFF